MSQSALCFMGLPIASVACWTARRIRMWGIAGQALRPPPALGNYALSDCQMLVAGPACGDIRPPGGCRVDAGGARTLYAQTAGRARGQHAGLPPPCGVGYKTPGSPVRPQFRARFALQPVLRRPCVLPVTCPIPMGKGQPARSVPGNRSHRGSSFRAPPAGPTPGPGGLPLGSRSSHAVKARLRSESPRRISGVVCARRTPVARSGTFKPRHLGIVSTA